MENQNLLKADKDQNYMNRRTLSSRKDKRDAVKNLTSQQSARTFKGPRSINLKQDIFMKKEKPNHKLVPSFSGKRGQSVKLKKVTSERNFIKPFGKKQTVPQASLGIVLPPMK